MLHATRTTTAEPEPVQSLSDWARARLRALSGCGLHKRESAGVYQLTEEYVFSR
jgi:hypothetical protein